MVGICLAGCPRRSPAVGDNEENLIYAQTHSPREYCMACVKSHLGGNALSQKAAASFRRRRSFLARSYRHNTERPCSASMFRSSASSMCCLFINGMLVWVLVLAFGNELDRYRVHTMPGIRLGKTLTLEDMAQVTATRRTQDFYTLPIWIRLMSHCVRDLLVKTGPPTTRMEFSV